MSSARSADHREVEDKYDVDTDFAVPPLDGLVPGGHVEVEPVQLQSTYYDTADRHLLRTRLTLRRRTGDTDTGWQLKVPDGDARIELRWPLTGGRGVPADVRAVTLGVRGRAALAPVATLAVERRVHRLVDADGRCLAEVVHDAVTATRPDDEPRAWHEVEVELVDGDAAVLRAAGRVLRDAGARRSASASKLARALGTAPDPALPKRSLARVVGTYLDRQWETVVRGDLALRRGELPVHGTRTAIRRYRSVLRVLAPVLDTDRAAALDTELKAFGLVLGRLRDVEVLRPLFDDLVGQLPDGIDRRPVTARLGAALDAEHDAGLVGLEAWLRSARHLALLAELRDWHADLPIDRSRPATDALAFLERADRRAQRRATKVPAHHAPDDQRMHRARKAAKRARYVAELAAGPSVGHPKRVARAGKRNKKAQETFGTRQDAVVAAEFLRGLAGEPGPAGFGLGVLFQLCVEHAEA